MYYKYYTIQRDGQVSKRAHLHILMPALGPNAIIPFVVYVYIVCVRDIKRIRKAFSNTYNKMCV